MKESNYFKWVILIFSSLVVVSGGHPVRAQNILGR